MISSNTFFVNGALKLKVFSEQDELIKAINCGANEFKNFLEDLWVDTNNSMAEIIVNPLEIDEKNNFDIKIKIINEGIIVIINLPHALKDGDSNFVGIAITKKNEKNEVYYFMNVIDGLDEEGVQLNNFAEWVNDEDVEIYENIITLNYSTFAEAIVNKLNEYRK